jgi:hypothetical protein
MTAETDGRLAREMRFLRQINQAENLELTPPTRYVWPCGRTLIKLRSPFVVPHTLGYSSAGRAHRSQRWRLPFSPFACLHLPAKYGPKRSNSGLPGELPQQFFRL